MRKTICIDIDGTIMKHQYPEFGFSNPIILEGVKEAFKNWSTKDYYIILTTGRKESMREETINQLKKLHLSYDLLLMGLPRGERVIVNDMKPDGTLTARAFNIERDKGLDEDIINL